MNNKSFLPEKIVFDKIPTEELGYLQSTNNNENNCFGCKKYRITNEGNSCCSKYAILILDDNNETPIKPDRCKKESYKRGMVWTRQGEYWDRKPKRGKK